MIQLHIDGFIFISCLLSAYNLLKYLLLLTYSDAGYEIHTWFILAALQNTPSEQFEILERQNVMAEYPSDFDVILFQEPASEVISDQLMHHPLIKSVTPQRKVIRSLKSLRKSLTLPGSAAFWQSTGRHSSRRLLRTVPRYLFFLDHIHCRFLVPDNT